MDIGGAMLLARAGHKVARSGWNGKGMFVYFVPANKYPATTDVGKEIADAGGSVAYREYLALKTVDGTVSTWAPSVNDVLADDWELIAPVLQTTNEQQVETGVQVGTAPGNDPLFVGRLQVGTAPGNE